MTLTDEQLAEMEILWGDGNPATRTIRPEHFRVLLDEVTALRHDVTQHMEIANEHLAEVERLRSHITAARSFRVLNENAHADRHLSEAMGLS